MSKFIYGIAAKLQEVANPSNTCVCQLKSEKGASQPYAKQSIRTDETPP